MQAIYTKYLPCTNVKGSRIKAQCDRGSITISYPDELSGDEVHIYAAECLVQKFVKEDFEKYASRYPDYKSPWSKSRVCGAMPQKIGGCVHVFRHGVYDGEFSKTLKKMISELKK